MWRSGLSGPHLPLEPALYPGSDLDHQNSLSYLDQAVTLCVKELEHLLEVLHLVLGEPLGLLGHVGEVGGFGGGAVGTCLRTRALQRTGAGPELPTAPHADPQPLPPLSYVRLLSRGAAGGSRGATYARAGSEKRPRASDATTKHPLFRFCFSCEEGCRPRQTSN